MMRVIAIGLLVCTLILSVSTIVCGYSHCNCDDEGFWSINIIMECQKVSDFLIAIAYFSIPIELVYFISCANVPFKWVLVEFIGFIVLCGMTHLLNGWTYYGPHSFQLMMSLTIFKFLTALVSCATAITLLTLIPLLLKLKVRELFLTQNVLELDQEVGIMKKKKEASWHVRMLTREIRKSLDKHTILHTTLVELSNILDLQNCAVWMPNNIKTSMNLTHELKPSPSNIFPSNIPMNDRDVQEIRESEGVRILRPDSALGMASSGGLEVSGSVAAIRMPLLNVSNFKGGTPELVQTSYAILVLVLPSSTDRAWSHHELEMVEVVADQVAVALSHANVLEESQLMRDQLKERNRVLQQAKKDAIMANQARDSFQKVMSHGMRRPMHSILGLLSMFEENMNFEQKIMVDTMARTGNVISTLLNDVTEISTKDNGRFPLEMRLFHLHSMIKETSCLAKCLFVYQGFSFSPDVESSLPAQVIGDERRTFQVLLHMVGHLLHFSLKGGLMILRVSEETGSVGKNDNKWGMWRSASADEFIKVKFEFDISGGHPTDTVRRTQNDANKEVLSFNMCKRLAQMMQGDIWISLNSYGLPQTMTLVLRFQKQKYLPEGNSYMPEHTFSNSRFRGLKVMIADDDNVNRTVTKRLLEKLGCEVFACSSGYECLTALAPSQNTIRVVLLDLHMPEMDGFEVARRIRKLYSRGGPSIIAITASAEDNIWERCLQIGMNGLIRKPVVLQGIIDEFRRVLR
ncbi:protein EIN4-like [Chenopodium quinoa]|uniref:Ethylene receptor n=1 Tax=Chenopodium quinoa TaxID=63459 RepID=A0A803KPX5_CHEQI|nr:protein EIN4-like [Chenopodium quinoa]